MTALRWLSVAVTATHMWSPSHRSTLTASASSSDLGVATPPHAGAADVWQRHPGRLDRRRWCAPKIAAGPLRHDEVHDQVATLVIGYRGESGDIGGHGT